MREVAERLRWLEGRLERLVASGFRNAGGETVELAAEADVLAGLGLSELADRLRKVAVAGSAAEVLPAIAITSAACRRLRARLPADEPPPGGWSPLVVPSKRKPSQPDRLMPVARMALDGGEVWACVRLHGVAAVELVLVDPPSLPEGQPAEHGQAAGGIVSRLLHGGNGPRGGSGTGVNGPDGRPPWLHCGVQAHLRWHGRCPLGAAGEVQRCTLEKPEWLPLPFAEVHPLVAFRQALAHGKLEDGLSVLPGSGLLRLRELDASDVDSHVWPDSTAATAFHAAAHRQSCVWAVVWLEGVLITPLAVIVPGNLVRKPHLVHLVPGCPAEALAG